MSQPLPEYLPETEWQRQWETMRARSWHVVGPKLYPRGHVPLVALTGRRPLPEDNESVRAIRAIEQQIKGHVPVKEIQ